ncbi:hypothetical protein DV451_003953 [Geotrichum candidum]|uniref:U3 small nucleolar RNA-associated protein 13 C-terminal domain-containing protein n=1 Tax=Geotrichum candidum TaxID=1173061 RepID=A0A9P5G313_GEOCN|nr:hypothetical protein DV451_003953 [Geotrichum candidum]
MADIQLKTSFKAKAVEPFFSGGKVSVSQDGKLMATTFQDVVYLTDLITGEKLAKIEGDGEVITTLEIAPDSSYLVTCSRSLQMKTYKLPEAKLVRTVKAHESPVIVMAIDPTSTLIATGGAEGAVKVWDLEGGYTTHNLRGHGGIISALKFWGRQGMNNWRLASGSDDCKIRVWDLVKSKCFYENKDVQLILAGGENGSTSVWDYKTAKKVLETNHRDPHSAEETGVSDIIYKGGDIGLLLTILTDETLLELDLSKDLDIKRRISGNHGEIIDCTYVGEDESYLAIATNSPEVRILKWGSLEHSVLAGHTDIVMAIDRSVDGRWLATAGKDRLVMLWDLQPLFDGTGEAICHSTYTGHADAVTAIALSRTLTSGPPEFIITGSNDLTIKRWTIPRKDGEVGKAAYTRKAHEKEINAIDVSPDNKLFTSSSQDRLVKVWDLQSGESIGVLKGHKRSVWSVKFSHFDKVIATGSGDKTVKLWSLNDFSCLKTFEGHTNSVLKVAFTTRGQQIVSAGGDGLVKIWNVKSDGECASTLDNHEDKVWSLAAREDETGFISGGGDGIITFWEDVSEAERLKDAETRAEQIEKEQELDNYVFNKDWKNAIILALSLDQPYKLLKLFMEVSNNNLEEGSITGLVAVDRAIGELDLEMVARLLKRVRDWNTNGRTSPIAQMILHAILCHHSVDTLSQIPGLIQLVEGILPYSERHFNRMEELAEESFTIDFALKQMNI